MSSLIFMFYVAAYIIKSILSKHEGNKMLKQRIVDFDKTLSKQDYSQLKVSFQQTQLPCSYKNKKKNKENIRNSAGLSARILNRNLEIVELWSRVV